MPYTHDFVTAESCDAIAGWAAGGQASAPVLEAAVFKEGTGSIRLGKSGVAATSFWYDKTLAAPIDVRVKIVVVWVYIAEEANTLNLLNTAQSRVYLFDASGNYAYWSLPKGLALKMGWNSFRFLVSRSMAALYTRDGTGGTEPNYAAITAVRLYFETFAAASTIPSGSMLMDFWHYGTRINCDNMAATMAGIVAYDASNAIGCIFEHSNWLNYNGYFIGCAIFVGLGTNATTLNPQRCAFIILPLTVPYTAQIFFAPFVVQTNATLTFGLVVDLALKKVRLGCMFIGIPNEMGSINYPWIIYTGTGTLYLYASSFQNSQGGVKIINGRIWSCQFQIDDSIAVYGNNVDLDNVVIYGDAPGQLSILASPTMNNIRILQRYATYGCISASGLTANAVGTGITLIKSDPTRPHTYCYNNGSYELILIDLDVPEDPLVTQWYRYGSTYPVVRQQYRIPFKLVDKNGDPVQGFLIEILDKNDNLVASGSTDVNGEWTSPAVTYKTYQETPGYTGLHLNTTITDYGPHTIRISKAGWQTHQWKANLRNAWQRGGVKMAQKATDFILVDGKPALNLSEIDPENELFAMV